MSTPNNILNFSLSFSAQYITEVVLLFAPEPLFQFSETTEGYVATPDAQLTRNPGIALKEFPATDSTSVSAIHIPLPTNAYSFTLPSIAYGTSPTLDSYSVLQINTALAPIEPGFSRIRVSYNWYNASNNSVVQQVDYLDCPFYEGWDLSAKEINDLKDYIE